MAALNVTSAPDADRTPDRRSTRRQVGVEQPVGTFIACSIGIDGRRVGHRSLMR